MTHYSEICSILHWLLFDLFFLFLQLECIIQRIVLAALINLESDLFLYLLILNHYLTIIKLLEGGVFTFFILVCHDDSSLVEYLAR